MGDSVQEIGWDANAQLARESLEMKPTKGIPQWMLLIMDWGLLNELAGAEPGTYQKEPERVYLECQRGIGTCFIDQHIPRNPLTMTDRGYESNTERKATTGAEESEDSNPAPKRATEAGMSNERNLL